MKTINTVKPVKAMAMISAIDQAIIKNAISKVVSKPMVGKTESPIVKPMATKTEAPKALFTLIADKAMQLPKFLHSAIANHKAFGRFTGTNGNCTLTNEGATWFANREGRAWGTVESDKEYREAITGARYEIKQHHGVDWPVKANGMPYAVGCGFIGRMAFFRVLSKASSAK